MIPYYITIWLLCSVIAGLKQHQTSSNKVEHVLLTAFFGPISLIIYAIRATIFEK